MNKSLFASFSSEKEDSFLLPLRGRSFLKEKSKERFAPGCVP
jgi:hypothetical protein